MMPDRKQEDFRTALRHLGFDEVRFAGASAVAKPYRDRFSKWLADGGHADMAWLERTREKRVDPAKVLADPVSVVVLGVNYWPDRSEIQQQERWAKYALYSDYHDTIEKALRGAGALMEERFGVGSDEYRYYVDTGPVMERGWAARSGLGFQGKNGMLISRTHGNWLFLSIILTRIRFEPDAPLEGGSRGGDCREAPPEVGRFCGTCRRCIDACPTDAIPEPGVVDSNRCISYHTIENKGVIPRALRPSIGGHIFGCDVCLDVCPWNRFARAGRRLLLAQRYDLAELSLPEILEMSPERFREVFRGTPVKRLKWRGLMRNACVVAGNLYGDAPAGGGERERVLEALLVLAGADEPIVRVHAVWAVYRLAGHAAALKLRDRHREETDSAVLEEYACFPGQDTSLPGC